MIKANEKPRRMKGCDKECQTSGCDHQGEHDEEEMCSCPSPKCGTCSPVEEIPRRMKVQCSGALLECNGCLHARPHEPNSECENDCQDPDAKGGHCCPVDTYITDDVAVSLFALDPSQ